MKTLLGGLILTCLMLLTACNSTETWDTWEIKCWNPEYNTWDTRRLEGTVMVYDGYVTIKPRGGGVERHRNPMCSYKFLGEAGVINND